MIPDPENEKTYEESKLKWNEVNQAEHMEMLQWYRTLIRLRRSTPCLNNGGRANVRVAFDEEKKWLRMERGTISAVCNLGAQDCSFPVPQSSSLELASRSTLQIAGNAICLPPDSIAVFRTPRIKNA